MTASRSEPGPHDDSPEAVWLYVPPSPYEPMRALVEPHPDGEWAGDDTLVITSGTDAAMVAAALRRAADDIEARGVEYGAVYAV